MFAHERRSPRRGDRLALSLLVYNRWFEEFSETVFDESEQVLLDSVASFSSSEAVRITARSPG